MIKVGFHETDMDNRSPVPEKAVRVTVRSTALASVGWPGTAVTPLDAVAGPDQYLMDDFPIVSFAPPAPVLKTVADTVAVNEGATRPLAVTLTVPNCADSREEPMGAVPRLADAGALMDTAAPAGTATASKAKPAVAQARPALNSRTARECQARRPGTRTC